MPLGYHVTFRARDDRVIATSDAARRRLARSLLGIGRDFGLLAFGTADTHSHAEVTCDRADAGEFARRVQISLTQALSIDCGFQPAYFKTIHDQWHLDNTFWYVLGQKAHHGLGSDPFHEASSLPDLLGLRTTGLYTARFVREHLPRTQRSRMLEIAGVSTLEPGPVCLDLLAQAAASATALPDLRGRSLDAIHARTAAITIGLESASTTELAAALGVSPRTVRDHRCRRAPESFEHAIRLQLSLRSQVDPSPLFAAEPQALYAV